MCEVYYHTLPFTCYPPFISTFPTSRIGSGLGTSTFAPPIRFTDFGVWFYTFAYLRVKMPDFLALISFNYFTSSLYVGFTRSVLTDSCLFSFFLKPNSSVYSLVGNTSELRVFF
jgi:hypothetical protein